MTSRVNVNLIDIDSEGRRLPQVCTWLGDKTELAQCFAANNMFGWTREHEKTLIKSPSMTALHFKIVSHCPCVELPKRAVMFVRWRWSLLMILRFAKSRTRSGCKKLAHKPVSIKPFRFDEELGCAEMKHTSISIASLSILSSMLKQSTEINSAEHVETELNSSSNDEAGGAAWLRSIGSIVSNSLALTVVRGRSFGHMLSKCLTLQYLQPN